MPAGPVATVNVRERASEDFVSLSGDAWLVGLGTRNVNVTRMQLRDLRKG